MRHDERVLADAIRQAKVTRDVVVAPGALSSVAAVASRHFPGTSLLLVSDRNTHRAAGERVASVLAGAQLAAETLVLDEPGRLKPKVEHSRRVAQRMGPRTVPVAVGSGVVNDLVKYAAALAGRPYLCIPTAASMDGYAASGAALLDEGFKRTLPCAPPVAIVVDVHVIAAAPRAMAGWGYGDLVGKIVAGADWLLADALGEEPISPGPYALVQDHLSGWLDEPARIAEGEPEAMRKLAEGLLISGFAMQAHVNSRPASGSEHQFSHLWEMEGLTVDGVPAAHGACVGVGTVAMLALYQRLVTRELTPADIERAAARHRPLESSLAEVAAAFGTAAIRDSALTEVRAKRPTPTRLAERLSRLVEVWPDLSRLLQKRLPPAATVQGWLRAAGTAASISNIGIPAEKLAGDYRRARLIRRRFTALDLVEDLAWLDEAVDSLFAPGGFWHAELKCAERAAEARAAM